MKWYYGIASLEDGVRVVNNVKLVRAESSEEADAMATHDDPFYNEHILQGFRLSGVGFYEIPGDVVRRMAADYGILPEGGGK